MFRSAGTYETSNESLQSRRALLNEQESSTRRGTGIELRRDCGASAEGNVESDPFCKINLNEDVHFSLVT